jgi:N-acetylglucosaminyl-diphospho-decaprenol L-rhamnosyltransferase
VDKFPSRERAADTALEPRVTAIVVVRHTRAPAPLELSLRSALAEPWIDDLVIVDHGASEPVSSTLRALRADRRGVRIVRADAGTSAAAAANVGAAQARGRWLLFLDPDIVLRRGAVARMAAAGGEARAPWIVGGRLTDTEGRERTATRAGVLNAWSALAVAFSLSGKPARRRNRRAPAAVSAVSGAFMLIARADFQSLGGFDVGFLTDAADLDLCRRAADAGGSVLLQPEASGVQFARAGSLGRKQAQGLALFASRCARTPAQRAFAAIAEPALGVLFALRDFVVGQPPIRR